MSVLRPAQITNEPFSVWANSVQDSISDKQMSVSSDFIQCSGPNGKFISLHPQNKYNPTYMNYVGEWNVMDGYKVNDVVRVLPGKNYMATSSFPWYPPQTIPPLIPISQATLVDTPNPLLPPSTMLYAGFIAPSEYTVIVPYYSPVYYPVPGTYICVSNVPSLYYAVFVWMMWFKTYAKAPSSQTSYQILLNYPELLSNINVARMWDVNYFPTWPEMPNVAVLNPKYLTQTWGRYWELMSLLPSKMYGCSGGYLHTMYVDQATTPSGSANYTGSI